MALIGGVVYAIVSCPDGDRESARAAEVARDFLHRLGEQTTWCAGIGRVVSHEGELPRSRVDADRCLRVLQTRMSHDRVARWHDVQAQNVLLDLADLAAAQQYEPAGPVARLYAYDRARQSHMVETLRAWFDAFGDLPAAAAAAHVHPNTFRYRLRRATEIAAVDLGDPDVRFAVMIELRMARLSKLPSST